MRVDVDLQGISKAINQVSKWEQGKRQTVRDIVNESAINMQTGAKRRCKVDTGRLRASIAMQPYNDGLTLQVGTKVHYAPYVEFGTGKFVDIPASAGFSASGRQTPWLFPESKGGTLTGEMIFTTGSRPQPFLFPAAEEEKPRFIKSMRGALSK